MENIQVFRWSKIVENRRITELLAVKAKYKYNERELEDLDFEIDNIHNRILELDNRIAEMEKDL